MGDLKRLLRPGEAAEFLSISKARVYELTRKGDLPVVVLGERQYRYDVRELEQRIASKQVDHREPKAA